MTYPAEWFDPFADDADEDERTEDDYIDMADQPDGWTPEDERNEAVKTPAESDPTVRTLDAATAKAIVFDTKVARSLGLESPDAVVQLTASRIWSNLAAYFATGDWPDRRRTAEEIDTEGSVIA